jgi:hypothetical protein
MLRCRSSKEIARWVGGLALLGPLLVSAHVTTTVIAPKNTQADNRATIQLVPSVGPNDKLGQTLADGVRQRLGQSQTLRLVDTPDQAGLILHLVTLSPDPKNQITVYGETYTVAPHAGRPEEFVFSTVTVCGETRIQDCADGIVQEMDNVLKIVRSNWAQHAKATPLPSPPIQA